MPKPTAWRRALLLGAVLLALAAASLLQRTPIVTDISAFLPGPADRTQALLADQLRDGVASRALLIGIEAGDADAAPLAALSGRLARTLRADAHFQSVANGDAAAVEALRRVVSTQRYLLSPRVEPGAFTADGLHAALRRLADMLQSSLAPVIKPLAAEDPTLELWHLVERFADRAQPATRHGAWFTADGRTALLVAQTRAPGSDIDGQQAALVALRRAFEAAAADWPADRARPTLQVAGPAAFAVASRALIERDASRLSALAAGAIALLLLAALRRPALLPLAAVPVLLGGLAGFAAVALVHGSVHGITIGFGMTLIGEAVDYAIYVLLQRAGTAADARLWRSLWLAVLTSSIGFVAMILSGFAGLAQLGLFSVAGIGAAGASARWLLPPWLPASGPARAAVPPRLSRLLDALPRLRGAIVLLALAAGALVAARGAHLWNDELAALSPLPPQAGELDQRLRGALGLPDLRMVVAIDGADPDQALERAEQVEPLLQALARDGVIAGHDSPATFVPSARTQALRRAALPPPAALRDALARAAVGTPFDPQAFEPFVAAVERARHAAPIDPQTYAGTPIGEQLAAQLLRSDERSTVLITVRGVTDPAMLRSRLQAAAPAGLAVADLKNDLESLISRYRQRALLAAAGGALAIVALLGWRLRDPGAALRIAVALACAVSIAAGAVVLVDGRLTLFHLVALLLVVGIGSNYALFFAIQPGDAAERAAVRGSVLLCAASTFVAFAFLAAASAPVLHIIGLTVSIGTIASLVAGAAIVGARRPARLSN